MRPFCRFGLQIIFLLSITTVFTPVVATAAERKVAVGAGVTNNTGQDKTDYHVKVSSDSTMDVTDASLLVPKKPGEPFRQVIQGGVVGDNTNMFTVDWDVAVKQNEKINWAVIFTQDEENKYSVSESFFTPQASPTDVPLVGWRVTSGGDVWLTNVFAIDINFYSLLFQFPADITVDSILALTEAVPSGMPGLLSSGMIPGASSSGLGELLVASFPFLNPGDFLTARLDTTFDDPAFSTLSATVALGHEHQVPEPPIVALMALGIVGFVAARNISARTHDA